MVSSGGEGAAPAPFGKEAEFLVGFGRLLRLVVVIDVVVMGVFPPLTVASTVEGAGVSDVVSAAESFVCRLRGAKLRGRRS